MPENEIVWSEEADRQFSNALDYILSDSPKDASDFQIKLSTKLDTVAELPESCPPDKYKTNNDGSFRAFELFSYRFTRNQVRILRFRHVSMRPKRY